MSDPTPPAPQPSDFDLFAQHKRERLPLERPTPEGVATDHEGNPVQSVNVDTLTVRAKTKLNGEDTR